MHLKKFLLFGLIAAVLPAVAEEAADRKTATSLKYVEHELDTRQNKFTAEQNKAMEYTNTAGDVQKRTVKSALGSDTSDTSLPMVGGVNTKLATKQDDIAPINDHTAVTYTGTSGKIGAKGIYQDTGTYIEQSNNLIDAKTFNAALKRGLDSEFICSANRQPGTNTCWLWEIHSAGEPSNLNLFDMSLIPDTQYIVHNADGSVTVTASGSGSSKPTYRTLSQLAPGLQVGKNYKLSLNTTGIHQIYLSGEGATWNSDQTRNITQGMLNATVYLYATGPNTTATIYDIRIIDENPEMPFETLVPSDYTPVEWIQGDGTAYIDTGIPATGGNMPFDVKFQTGNITGTEPGYGNVFGSRIASSRDEYQLTMYTHGTIDVGGGRNSYLDFNTNGVHTIKYANGVANIDGVSTSLRTGTISANLNIYLFGINQAGLVTQQESVKIYYVSFGNLFNGIPARRNRDNVLGMYDTVSGEFFENAGSGAFTAGPDISNIVYIPQNQ